ncbi:MAG: ABC transporter ATP-binding protein [Burkholderiales bacterium]|nr:ABC transporter ATP-binding protein [Burkholderiales bacterium]
MALLEVANVSLAFGGVRALSGVSLEVEEGTVTSVIGPNGAGKTSLYNVISGFYRPQTGAVRFAGGDVTALKANRRAALGMARTFQNIALFRGLTVLDNIKLGAHHTLRSGILAAAWYLGGAAREEAALTGEIEARIIDLLHLGEVRHAPVAALPYGMQKRVELARALAMRPRLLMLDEPVAGMNREEKEDMARYILDVREEWGVTVLLIEHDMGMVMDLSDRIHVLNFGERLASGTPADVRADPAVVEAYLGES